MKKLLNLLLVGGVILGAITLTASCKDYDDDINNLERNLDSNVTTLTQQLQTVQQNAQDAVDAVQGNLDRTDGRVTTLENNATAQGDSIADLMLYYAKTMNATDATAAAKDLWTTSREAIDSLASYADNIRTLQAATKLLDSNLTSLKNNEIANLTAEVQALWGAVTEVKIVGYLTTADSANAKIQDGSFDWNTYDKAYKLNYSNLVIPADYTFGAAEKDWAGNTYTANQPISYKKGDYAREGTDLIIRVNPTNADISEENIKLLNSQGKDLSDIINIDSVRAYSAMVTRASSTSGLWRVYTTLKDDVTDDMFSEKEYVDPETGSDRIAYAVAVNVKGHEDRYVISDYAVLLNNHQNEVEENSWATEEIYFTDEDDNYFTDDNGDQLSIRRVKGENQYGNTRIDYRSTLRSEYSPLEIANNSTFELHTYNYTNLQAFYVALDQNIDKDDYATTLKDTIKGLNQVVYVDKGNGKASIKVKVPKDNVGKEIAFRIFAVNTDGSLTSAQGSSFYVKVGAEVTPANEVSVTGNMNVTLYDYRNNYWYTYPYTDPSTGEEIAYNRTSWLLLTGTLTDGSILPTEVSEDNLHFHIDYAVKADGTGYTAGTTANKDIKYVRFTLLGTPNNWEDGSEVELETSTTNATTGAEVDVFKATLTKVIPYTQASTSYVNTVKWRENQLVNGVYTAFVQPYDNESGTTWTKRCNRGIFNMYNAFTNTDSLYVAVDDAGLWGNVSKIVRNSQVDGTTQHNAQLYQTFGELSSEYSETTGYDVVFPFGEAFKVVFAWPLDDAYMTYNRNSTAVTNGQFNLTATKAADADYNVLEYVTGTNTAYSNFNNTTAATMCANYYVKTTVSFTGSTYYKATYNNGKITFERTTTALPTADTDAKLTLTLTDAFGHEHIVPIEMVIKKAE